MADRNVLLVSNYNAVPRPWNGVPFEFFSVISQIEAARIVAPAARIPELAPGANIREVLTYVGHELGSRARRVAGGRATSEMRETELDADYDLCLFMCQFPRNLPEIDQVRHWRARSRKAVAFVLESWSSDLHRHRAALRLLDRFDHVFVLNAASIPALQRHTRTPVSFLPTAADCLIARPGPERVVDFLSMGRRLPKLHREFSAIAAEQGAFYVYDLWKNLTVRDWAEARAGNADIIRRSRYFIAWDPTMVSVDRAAVSKDAVSAGERALSTRYFEGAAGGAILLGSRPGCPEFDDLFDWPDAVVEIAPDGSDLREVLAALDGDPDRSAAARNANLVNSLRRHDWAVRWASILDALGLPRTTAHEARLRRLDDLARQIEVEADWPATYKMLAE